MKRIDARTNELTKQAYKNLYGYYTAELTGILPLLKGVIAEDGSFTPPSRFAELEKTSPMAAELFLDEGKPAGFLLTETATDGRFWLHELYVMPFGRRQGTASQVIQDWLKTPNAATHILKDDTHSLALVKKIAKENQIELQIEERDPIAWNVFVK